MGGSTGPPQSVFVGGGDGPAPTPTGASGDLRRSPDLGDASDAGSTATAGSGDDSSGLETTGDDGDSDASDAGSTATAPAPLAEARARLATPATSHPLRRRWTRRLPPLWTRRTSHSHFACGPPWGCG